MLSFVGARNVISQASSLVEIAAELRALEPFDFDSGNVDSNANERLYSLCEELSTNHLVDDVAPLLFELIERLDGSDLGSPGPVVHTLEAMPGYGRFLRASFSRKPTALSAWMVNRIVNAGGQEGALWLHLLGTALVNKAASTATIEEVTGFLRFHRAA